MRILHVVPSYIPAYRYGGPIYSVHGLCKSLAKRGNEVDVFTTNVDGRDDSDVPLKVPVDLDGVKVWYFASKRLRRIYWSQAMVRALRHRVRTFDLLHLHTIYNWPVWAAARAARRDKIPYIETPRGMLMKDAIRMKNALVKKMWIWLMDKRNLENASAVHVTSRLEAEELRLLAMNPKRVVIVPNGVEFREDVRQNGDISREIKQALAKKPFFLFLSRINWKKGLDRLIPSMAYVPNTFLIIAGNDEENYTPVLKKIAEERGVKDRIIFMGPVYGANKIALLKKTIAMVLPSYSENFGNVVVEAMAIGCPVVVTPEVGVADIVKATGAGIVVDGTPETLGGALNKLLLAPGLLQEMSVRGPKTVAKYFTWEAVSKRMEEVYQYTIEMGGNGRLKVRKC